MSFLADILASLYIAMCFLKYRNVADKEQTVVLSRGAFRRDIASFSQDKLLVVVVMEWVRRFLRFGVPDGYLEQVVCLSYKQEIRAAFPLTMRTFAYFVNKRRTRLVFGGVDYFEVAMFADHSFYQSGTSIDAVFHENYAIEYGRNLNFALYNSITDRFLFDELYTYGPPANEILVGYTSNPNGSLRMVMPRLARMEDDSSFLKKLNDIDEKTFEKTILLLAFPGAEYIAPICFTATLLELARMGNAGECHPVIKFKNQLSAKSSLRQAGTLKRGLRWVYDGSVEELVWQAGFTIVFNSISLYEALLGPTIIIIPAYLDSQHDQNMLQESRHTIANLGKCLQSVLFAGSLSEIKQIMSSFDGATIKATVCRERALRKQLISTKFYLTLDAQPVQGY